MKKILLLAAMAAASTTAYSDPHLAAAQHTRIEKYVDQQASTITNNALAIWKLAEPGFRENKSSALLQETLHNAGFQVEAGVAGMPTAFVARYRTGAGPVIAILAEFDALPGISQMADQSSHVPIPGAGAGHACGHNLLGSGAVGGAIAVSKWLKDTDFKGEVRVYGSPAEEGGDGKVYLVRAGLFNDVDVALHWHPNSSSQVASVPLQGNLKTDFTFHGFSAHAANSPDKGRSALAAAELMDVAISFQRQFVPDGSRIHNIVTSGGSAPNVVPDFAQTTYYVRHVDQTVVRDLQERIQRAAQGAALATDTKVEWEIRGGVYPVLVNQTLLPLVHRNLLAEVADLHWTPEESSHAVAIQNNIGLKKTGTDTTAVDPIVSKIPFIGGSSDVGDISYVVPTVGFGVAAWPAGTPPHSWASTAASGSSFGIKATIVAAKVLAITAAELMLDPETVAAAKAELKATRGEDFQYKSLFGDRAPPLDYTDALMKNAARQ